MVGDQWMYFFNSVLKPSDNLILLKIELFVVIMVMSLIQLFLSFFVFKNDTPKELFQINLDTDCIYELARFYTDAERRMKEYRLISEIVAKSRFQYPSYSELFSSKYIKFTLQGLAMMCFRSFSGFLMINMFASLIFKNTYMKDSISFIFGSSCIICTLIPLFFSDSKFPIK